MKRALWIVWVPVAAACDITSLVLQFLRLPQHFASVFGFLLVHCLLITAASQLVVGAAAAATEMINVLSTSLFAPQGESILQFELQLDTSLHRLLFAAARLLLLLVLTLLLIVCVIARVVLACCTSLPWTCTITAVIVYLVSG